MLSYCRRFLWENKLFNHKYNYGDYANKAFERPKYGNVPLKSCYFNKGYATYGSCYLILKHDVKWRTTLTFGDSSHPYTNHAYNFDNSHLILSHYDNINKPNIYSYEWVNLLEAQIHGPIELDKDVESINIPSDVIANVHIRNGIDKFKKKGIIVNIF